MLNEEKLSIELTKQELAQINFSLISRASFCTQLWTCSVDEKTTKELQAEIEYLNALSMKIQTTLKESENNGTKKN